ncbi:MAG TPA: hypothetical protein VMW27_10120 [Thermoanaerobaculia bacterium]|nr:hypothetical protein [Thermoanaerobaculia bacterium]
MPNTILRSIGVLAVLAALLVPGVSMAQTSGSAFPALHDGVVVDAASGAAYVMSPTGGIDAVQLSTGNVLWKSRAGVKPLLVTQGTLVAQAEPSSPRGELLIVAIDTRAGRSQRKVEVKLPDGIRARLVDSPSKSFRAQAFAAANGDVVVTWLSEGDQVLQGAVPPDREAPPGGGIAGQAAAARAALSQTTGAARIDFAAGRAVAVPYAKAQALKPAMEKAATPTDLRQLAAIDGRHILSSERSPGGSLFMPYRWTIATAAGAEIATIDAPVSMAPFVIAGNRLFYVAQPSVRREGNQLVEEPLRLRSLDLATGNATWEKAVIDSTYEGILPP